LFSPQHAETDQRRFDQIHADDVLFLDALACVQGESEAVEETAEVSEAQHF